jgi:hypothetical protein
MKVNNFYIRIFRIYTGFRVIHVQNFYNYKNPKNLVQKARFYLLHSFSLNIL